jgi:biotin operon repressor
MVMSLRDVKAIKIDGRSGYSLADLVLMLRLLGREPMGRFSLMDELGLGEATVKTMMKKLEDEGLAKKSPRGQMPTPEGGRIFGLLEKRISDPVQVRLPDISTKPSVAFVVRGAASKIRKGIEQRDEGIKHGVDVTTLVFESGKIRFPGARNVVEMGELNDALEESDVILVSSGKSIREARRGGFAVGLTMI